jgi:hypothetical protein
VVRVGVGISVRHDYRSGAEEIGRVPEHLLTGMRRGTREAADVLEDAMTREIPRRTGRTASTIGSVVSDTPRGAEGFVGTSDQVAEYLEYGTRPHVITARNGKALRFDVGARTVFAKSVRHPGTPRYEWMLRSSEASVPNLRAAYEENVREALR